ncbi:MAG: hypothetical protein O7A64_06210, partial [Alphaproteobacteria bacterium]|nr:hypothetical protein [Alphaproteobacteria bacterium]
LRKKIADAKLGPGATQFRDLFSPGSEDRWDETMEKFADSFANLIPTEAAEALASRGSRKRVP